MMIVAISFQTIVKIVTLNTFFLSFLMSIGMLLSKHKNLKNQIFSGLFLAFSLIIFYFFLYESKSAHQYPYISAICLSGWYLIGPMVYLFALYSLNKAFKFSKKHYWHMLPAILASILGLLAVYLNGDESLTGFASFFVNKFLLIIGIIGSASFLIYLTITGIQLVKSFLWNFSNLKHEPSALASYLIFDVFIAASITDTLSLFTNNYIFIQIAALLFSVCVVALFLLYLIFPGFNKGISDVVEKEKQKRSYLSNIDTDNLKNNIHDLIYSKQVFTDDQLTLVKLASLAGVSSHQLSEFINLHYNKNFTTFINEFRIDKAKNLLLNKPEYTILAVAYDAGFNSKSAFNAAFRKITGLTPTEFKLKNQIN